MNRQELQRLIANLTDDELEQLARRDDETPAPEDPAREFLRAVAAERDRDRLAEITERLAAPSQPTTSRGNRVPREGNNPGPGQVTDRQRLVDFVRAVTDPTHVQEL